MIQSLPALGTGKTDWRALRTMAAEFVARSTNVRQIPPAAPYAPDHAADTAVSRSGNAKDSNQESES